MGCDKASLVIDGSPLISHVVHSLLLAGSESVLIRVRDVDDVARLSFLLAGVEVDWSLDDPAHPGMLHALRGSLEVGRDRGWDAVQLAAVDTPYVQPELFMGLTALMEGGCDAAVPTTLSAQDSASDGLEPLLACLRIEPALRALEALGADDLRVTKIFDALDSITVGPQLWSTWGVRERCFWNLNRPEDLK